MAEEYVKQIEHENEALKKKLETIFEWRVIDKPYRHEYIKDDQKFFFVDHELYINGLLFALVGKNTGSDGYRGICKGTTAIDPSLESIKDSIERTYMLMFYVSYRV